MENIVKLVTEKAGISEAQAKTAVDAVLTFLKDKMPAGIGSQVETFVKNGVGSTSDVVGGLKDKVGGILGK